MTAGRGERTAAIHAAAKRRARRGRPREIMKTFFHNRTPRLVLEVLIAARAAGGGRGAISVATRDISLRENIKPGTLKRAVTRHRKLSGLINFMAFFLERPNVIDELFWRLGEIREDSIVTGHVWRWLASMPAMSALQFLRDNQIIGHCPKWLRDDVTERDLLSPNTTKR